VAVHIFGIPKMYTELKHESIKPVVYMEYKVRMSKCGPKLVQVQSYINKMLKA